MKILVPLAKYENIDRYTEAGADEFYIGFENKFWNEEFGKFEEINRMSSFGSMANFPSIEAAYNAAKCIVDRGKGCFLSLNSAAYSRKQVEYLLPVVKQFVDLGVGIIVGDLSFAYSCAKLGASITLSTMGGVYNSASAKMVAGLGAKRIIFPRDSSTDNMKAIIESCPETKFEAFLMRNGCRYSDSNCMAFHARKYDSLCHMLDCSEFSQCPPNCNIQEKMDFSANHAIYNAVFHKKACGLCAIYRLVCMGICSVKIVGRADNPDEVANDIYVVKQNIKIAEQCDSEEAYLQKVIIPQNVLNSCMYGLNCYYPEIRF